MPDKAPVTEAKPTEESAAPVAAPTPPPKRSPGHRGQDVRDTVAEMAAKAHEISLEAGSKMAAAMKEVIQAAAGMTNFAVESARDLVQYMVRRGQMTQEEADKLIRDAEEADSKRRPGGRAAAPIPAPKPEPPTKVAPVVKVDDVKKAVAAPKAEAPKAEAPKAEPPKKVAAAKKPAAKAHASKPAKKAAPKPAAKAASKAVPTKKK